MKETLKRWTQKTAQVRLGNPLKSVGVKLFLLFFLSIVAFVLYTGISSYNISRTVVQEEVSDAMQQTVKLASEKLDMMMGNFETMSTQLIIDQELVKALADLDKTKEAYEQIQLSNKVRDKMNAYILANSNISGIYLFDDKGKMKFQAGNAAKQTDAGFKDQEWFKKMVEQNGRIVWLPTSKVSYSTSPEPNVFALGRVMKNAIFAKSMVMLVEYKVSTLVQPLSTIRLSDDGKIMIVDRTNKIGAIKDEEPGQSFPVNLVEAEKLANENKTKYSLIHMQDDVEQLVIYNAMNSTNWFVVGVVPTEKLTESAGEIFSNMVVISVIAGAIALILGLFIARSISAPLVRLSGLMKEGEQGNLTVRSKIKRVDEIGRLSGSFNAMMDQITKLVQETNRSAAEVLNTAVELSDASKKTAISAKEIAVATEEIANGSSSLAVEAERGSHISQTINDQMKQVVSTNVKMGEAASDVYKVSEQGTGYMSELTAKTGTTETMIRSMTDKVTLLKESTRSIRQILEVLDNMTKQTNILSLNAAIEASRAGAAGKGFMVVADEIRKLAEQSKQSIGVVGDITDTIVKEIDETVKVLTEAYPIFQEQIGSVKQADAIFGTVKEQMEQFIVQLDGVTESIGELDKSQLVLFAAMDNVSAVAEESSATSEEVASLSSEQLHVSENLVQLADKLETVSNALRASLSRFTVEEGQENN